MEPIARCPRYQVTLAALAARTATPAPAKVIFEVEANMMGRLGCSEAAARLRMSALLASFSVRCWKAYALSQKIVKSGAAAGMAARRAAISCETTAPVGLAYVGTIQMPLTLGSSLTS